MLRHKAMIQCARLAFGFGGIFDQDEADRIIERSDVSRLGHPIVRESVRAALGAFPELAPRIATALAQQEEKQTCP